MRSFLRRAGLLGAGSLAIATLGLAQIERLNLAQMMQKCDSAMTGKVVRNEVFRTDVPNEGLYFTRLTIQGRDLVDGSEKTIQVTYPGAPEEGAFNSEAPHPDEVKVGKEVVIFHRYEKDMGNGVSGNSLYAWHGGLYRVANGRNGKVVLGRGEGYAVSRNWKLADLDQEITHLREQSDKNK